MAKHNQMLVFFYAYTHVYVPITSVIFLQVILMAKLYLVPVSYHSYRHIYAHLITRVMKLSHKMKDKTLLETSISLCKLIIFFCIQHMVNCLPKSFRKTRKTQIRLLLLKQSDLGFPCLLFG